MPWFFSELKIDGGHACLSNLELSKPVLKNVLPTLMHVQHVVADPTISALLCQRAWQIFVCQIQANMPAIAIFKHALTILVIILEKNFVLLPNFIFARH